MERVFLHIPSIRIISFVLLVSLLILSEFTVHLEGERQYELHRNQVLNEASTLRAQLEAYINKTLHLTQGMVAYVSTHPDFSQWDFESIAEQLIRTAPNIRNIGLAKDNVISHIYPLQGNEAALGLDYLQHPQQREAVLRAINSGKTTVAGPVELVQGGVGFVSRTPIYNEMADDPARPVYWGLASVVIKADKLLFILKRWGEVTSIEYALRGKDGLGANGEVFFGRPELFLQDAVLLNVTLPEGSWQLAAMPQAGWQPVTGR